jgi:hypothetical protein
MGRPAQFAQIAALPSKSTVGAASILKPLGVQAELTELERLDFGALRLRWRNRWGRRAPAGLPKALLFRVMAYRLQADAFGDLDPRIKRLLDRLGEQKPQSNPQANSSSSEVSGEEDAAQPKAPPRSQGRAHDAPMVLKPGAVLSREWRGRMERVTAMEEGYSWNGKSYGSLSAAAFAITGVKWNGPRFFFGCKGRGKAGARPGAKPSQATTTPPAAARLQPCPDSRSSVRAEP